MSPTVLGIVFFFLILMAVPIGFVLAGVSFMPHIIDSWFPTDGPYLIRAMISGINSFPILAVPMFILSGNIMAKGGISEKMFNFFSYFIAPLRAGLPISVVVTCLFYGAISGSGPATAAAVGAMTIPVLSRLGYDKVFATALVAVAGGVGVIIPPSIPFIFYGQAANVSVGKLFIAGVVPGLLIGLCLMSYAYYYCLKNGEDRVKLNAYHAELKAQGLGNLFMDSFWALLSPIIILGSIYTGVASPTEAAVISVFYSLFVAVVIYKKIDMQGLLDILNDSVKTYASIAFIIAAAIAFARVLTLMEIPALLSEAVSGAVSNGVAFILLVNLVLLFVGMVMDTTPAILVLTPILLPLAKTYGFDPIHFGLIMVVNLAIGFVTPPLGVNLFVSSALTKISVEKIVKKAVPFIGAFIVALLIVTFVPSLSLMLIK